MCLVVTCTPTGNNIVVSELHVVLRAPLRRQAADGAHAALVVDAEVQRERGQHHHRREVQEDDVGVRGDLQDGGGDERPEPA